MEPASLTEIKPQVIEQTEPTAPPRPAEDSALARNPRRGRWKVTLGVITICALFWASFIYFAVSWLA